MALVLVPLVKMKRSQLGVALMLARWAGTLVIKSHHLATMSVVTATTREPEESSETIRD